MAHPSEIVDAAVGAISAGDLVVVPTDTVYGIGVRADLARATARIFEAKGRGREAPLPVLAASWDQAREVGTFDPGAHAIARLVWPGAVTLVVPRAPASRDWELGGDGTSVGLRIPDHAILGEILRRTGPLAVSSANLSGDAPPPTCAEIRVIFGVTVSVYVCDDRTGDQRGSTVLDLTGGEPHMLRRGDANAADLERWNEAWHGPE